MKYLVIVCFLLLTACQSNRKDVMTELLNEQKFLKDSANNITERIGSCTDKGVYDSAEVQKNKLGAVHARLINIQVSIDSLSKME
ncbi:MAG: hypothetical protein WDN26_21820 [Chitinophagaceae bacterium]